MPHLCPMWWPLMFIVFWFLLLTLLSIIWWHQLPNFPLLPSPTPPHFTPWAWK